MEQLLLFVVLGIGPGALIAGIALSIVLTYRGAGTINIAAGAVAMFGAYVYYGLRTGGYLFLSALDLGGPLSTVPAFLVTVIVCGLGGALMDLTVFRPLRTASPLAKLVGTVGVLLTLQAVVILRFGGEGQSAPDVLKGGTIELFGGTVPVNRLLLVGIVVVAAVFLAAIYRYTRFGLATRAAQENEAEATLSGLSPNSLSMANSVAAWMLAGALGVLVAPLTQLDPSTLTLAVVPALGAALLARFESFTVATLAGIAMGAIRAVVTYLQTKPWFPQSGGLPMPGVPELIYFVVIAGALVWRGKSLPERGAFVEARLPAAPAPRRIALPALIVTVVCVVGLLTFPFDMRQALINSLIGVIACLSLVMLTGFVGQVSLAQYALAGVAGLVMSKLAIHAGIGFPIGPAIGIVAATALGMLAALPALRVRGVQLAVLTLAAAVAIASFGFDNPSWGAGGNGSPVPEPHLLGIDVGPRASFPINGDQLPSPVFGFLCLAVVIGLAMLVASVRRSGLGQRMLAVRSNERAAAGAGVSPRTVKLTAFGLSAMIAAVAGTLYGYNFGSVDATRFSSLNTLALIAFAYIGGITTIKGAVIAGLLITEGLMGHIGEKYIGIPGSYQLLLAGVSLVLTVAMNPSGIALAPPPKFTFLRRLFRRPAPVAAEVAPARKAVSR
jgi:branched-chain amino acid transport system permease protein